MQNIALERGGKCLSVFYKNAHTKLIWSCQFGHQWEAIPNNVVRGNWCPVCAKKNSWELRRLQGTDKHKPRSDETLNLLLEKMKQIAVERQGKCLSTEYINSRSKLLWVCQDGHQWYASSNNISNGTWCPHCSAEHVNNKRKRTIEDLKAYALSKGGVCVSSDLPSQTTKVLWCCDKGHEWLATPQSVMGSKNWCPICGVEINKKRFEDSKPIQLERMRALAQERGGECIATEYHGQRKKIDWRCGNGHFWSAKPTDILRGGWCPECSSRLGERICRVYLECLFGVNFPKQRPEWLRSYSGALFELDGYSEELKLAFEHHGAYHYKIIPPYSPNQAALEKRQNDDLLKVQICRKNGVKVLVIPEVPLLMSLSELELYIVNEAEKLEFSVPLENRSKEISLLKAYQPETAYEVIAESARQRGGALLSSVFYGWNEPLKWKCAVGHEWEVAPTGVYHGKTWCPQCAGVSKNTINKMQDYAKTKQGKCLSLEYINAKVPLLWECAEGHQWNASPTNIISKKSWCPYCAGQRGRHLTIEHMKKVAIDRGGDCLSDIYVNSKTKLKWRCAEGHEWQSIPLNVVNKGSWCPICAKIR
jgi:hypothetical protein